MTHQDELSFMNMKSAMTAKMPSWAISAWLDDCVVAVAAGTWY
jgi:hypothetical protein